MRDRPTLERIRSLVLPPAWTDVWICSTPRGHIQATGLDARGRKQYRYHPDWHRVRDATKFAKMMPFAGALPKIRSRVTRDLDRPGLPRDKVLAAVTRLLETTFIRIGNEEYADAHKHFGLTTLRDRHVDVIGHSIRFEFVGKSGKAHTVDLTDPRLARIVKRCQELPGQDLFQFIDDNAQRRDVVSDDVNDYLQRIVGEEFTAKDFRTWAGTVLASLALWDLGTFTSQKEAQRNVARAIKSVAARLGNTPAVCRKSYVHPEVVNAYLDGSLVPTMERHARRVARDGPRGLRTEEVAVVRLLEARAKTGRS